MTHKISLREASRFRRGLTPEALQVLSELSRSSELHWWKDLLALWRPSGVSAGADGLRLAIRDRYLNFYRHGQSVARVGFEPGGRPYLGVHTKYVFGDKAQGQQYAKLTEVEVAHRQVGLTNTYEGLASLRQWVDATARYAGAEKLFIDRVVAANGAVIDLEMALPAWSGRASAVRIDLVALEKDSAGLRLGLWEAKLIGDARLRSLDAPEGATGLLPQSLDLTRPASVLISHPHQDHWGLVDELPQAWPIWTGSSSAKLITVTGDVTRRPLERSFNTWNSRSGPMAIGPFSVTPILTDHSAFDAHMLLVEGAGKRLLYTGDFRRHGRKSALVDRIMADPPADIDVLLTEGTNLGSDKPVKSESELEDDFVKLFDRTRGRVFVAWSGQNIDRTVTLYKAAKRTGRTLLIDLYTADVLDRISEGTSLPRPGMSNLKVVVTKGLRRNYMNQGREDFVQRMAQDGISARRLQAGRYVVMLRRGLIRDYREAGIAPIAEDAFNFSMWRGYLSDPYHAEAFEWCRGEGAEIAYLHTSGHASPTDLRDFALAVRPKMVVPVHGVKWDEEAHGFGAVRRLEDAERLVIA